MESTRIEYRTAHRLSDAMALQSFMLFHHLLRRALFFAICLVIGIVVATSLNGAPMADVVTDMTGNLGVYLAIFLVGLLAINLLGLLLAFLSWQRRPRPREIRAVITPETITILKDGINYGARWDAANLVTETGTAFLMKFSTLYMRLPKRGFADGDAARFRALATAGAPARANRLAKA